MGVALAIIYFVTGNLLMAVGAHALADAYMQIPRDATGYEDDLGYLYVALALVFAMVLRARRRGSQAPAIDRSANLHE
jgi:membrane protease YdiL (CAAX protease family)